MTQRMTHVVEADSVHYYVWSNKLQATTWAQPINIDLGTNAWAWGNGFLGKESSIRMV